MLSFLQTIAFLILVPTLALGGLFAMGYGMNIHSSAITAIGLASLPIGWIALFAAFRFELI